MEVALKKDTRCHFPIPNEQSKITTASGQIWQEIYQKQMFVFLHNELTKMTKSAQFLKYKRLTRFYRQPRMQKWFGIILN
ncbi:hypothetical protein DPV92_08940 [Haemophilus paraphrohaemolyticus]|uniref:Uncharacterized protein n=1 Tax=Haemophilus paraphrohaemolyticus TaxID=736 RepID=A0A369ZLL0_9PAST|nr:hypothetical protein DPV92_08940 [Haemophilus paraphrohaemolyticus]